MLKLAALALLTASLFATAALGQQRPGSQRAVLTLPDTAEWSLCDGWTSGCEALVVHGNPATGPSHLLVRLAPNAAIPLIRHSSTEHFVVVSGTFIATEPNGREIALRPGAHWYVPEGVVHGAFRCSGTKPCTFSETHDKPLVTVLVDGASPAGQK